MFPNIPAPGGVNVGFSECAKYHLAAKPVKGTGVCVCVCGGGGGGQIPPRSQAWERDRVCINGEVEQRF